MTPASRAWKVRLSFAAEADLENIMLWTVARFGERQARTYEGVLKNTLLSLRDGPLVARAKPRPEIARDLYSIHAAGKSGRGRHFVFFRVVGEEWIEIVRVLHDGMDFRRHLPPVEPRET